MSVKMRIKIEHSIVSKTVKDLLAKGYLLAVNGGDYQDDVPVTDDRKKLLDVLFDLDDAYLKVYFNRTGTARPDGWVRFVFGNDGWDVISDYTVNLEEHLQGAMKLARKYEELVS